MAGVEFASWLVSGAGVGFAKRKVAAAGDLQIGRGTWGGRRICKAGGVARGVVERSFCGWFLGAGAEVSRTMSLTKKPYRYRALLSIRNPARSGVRGFSDATAYSGWAHPAHF